MAKTSKAEIHFKSSLQALTGMDRVVTVDVETTGLSAQRGGRVIEVGAVALENGVIVAELDSLIDTGTPISYAAFRVHGISEAMLAGMPVPHEVWSAFHDFVGHAPLIAHNAPFDSAFVRHEFARMGVEHKNSWQCTVRLARKRLPQLPNHRLDTVYRYLFGNLPHNVKQHRALDDARMAARVWMTLSS